MGEGEELSLVVEEGGDDGLEEASYSSSAFAALCLCRICHEEEEESSTSMESPCACSGTLKFAHRGCVQRWCDEKGSSVCEICLQKFEAGYTIPEKKVSTDEGDTIRGRLEVQGDPQNPGQTFASDDAVDLIHAECSPASMRCTSCCRSVALTLTILLLIRHLFAVVSAGADQCAFSILTVYLLRASGILLPFYLVMRLIAAIQQTQRQRHLQELHDEEDSSTHVDETEEHAIEIHP